MGNAPSNLVEPVWSQSAARAFHRGADRRRQFGNRFAIVLWAQCLPLLCSVAVAEEPAQKSKPEESSAEKQITDGDREHWSFQPIVRPTLPVVTQRGWIRSPIDAFILAKLESKGWTPNPPAERHDLQRRVFLDLIGLPPTPDEQQAFLLDDSPDVYERLIDNLLSRPSHGERWGRHWLDLVRYAETNGYERDGAKPSVWRYRDYVIDAFNADKPYDRFVLEQFAGDELPDADPESVIATGFHRLGPWDDEPADFAQDRWDQLDDIIRTTSQTFLGITLGCARCHDHKFDPLLARDYYRLGAVVNTLTRPQNGRQELDLPAGTLPQRAALMERDRQIGDVRKQIAILRDSIRADFLASGQSELPAEAREALQLAADKRSPEQKQLVTKHTSQFDAELLAALPAELKLKIAEFERHIESLRAATPDLPKSYFLTEGTTPPPKTFLLLRGSTANPGPEVEPGMPAVLTREQLLFPPQSENSTSRRRLTFAQWMVDRTNPLTARVIVNRVWQYHFGAGIVRTPSDFGVIGELPTHPELLDWLAHWFVHDANWSLKKLHRLILASSTYRLSKAEHPIYSADDPRSLRLWRFPYRRLEVEAIRDSMLAASGQLRRTMGGPGVHLEIPPEVLAGNSDPNIVWPKFDEAAASRRTVYAFVKRALVVPFLEVLDVCDTTRSTELRNVTTIAPQALTLFNGDFVNRQSQHLADRVLAEAINDPAYQIDRAFRLTLCQPPTATELITLTQFLEREIAGTVMEASERKELVVVADAHRKALAQLCRVLLNLNEFAYTN